MAGLFSRSRSYLSDGRHRPNTSLLEPSQSASQSSCATHSTESRHKELPALAADPSSIPSYPSPPSRKQPIIKTSSSSMSLDKSATTQRSHSGSLSSKGSREPAPVRRRSRNLLEALRGPRTPKQQPSFEVVRVRKGSASNTSYEVNAPDSLVESPPAIDDAQLPPLLPSPAVREQQQPAVAENDMPSSRRSINLPKSFSSRGTLAALSRRISHYGEEPASTRSVAELKQPDDVTSPYVSDCPPSSFKLKSMRNVSYGSSHALDSTTCPEPSKATPSLQAAGDTSAASSGFASGAVTPTEPSAGTRDALSTPNSPVFATTSSSAKFYAEPAYQSSSISVAKFRTIPRQRNDSALNSPEERPHLPLGQASSLSNVDGMRPAERLAALEAEMARGGRATPLIRQLEELSQSKSTDYFGQAVVAPPVPEKETTMLSHSRRFASHDGLTNLVTPPPVESSAARRTRRLSERLDNMVQNFAPLASAWSPSMAGNDDEQPRRHHRASFNLPASGSTTPQEQLGGVPGKGRGWDSATFLARFDQQSTSPALSPPRTLLDALAQMDTAGDNFAPPRQPWLAKGSGEGFDTSQKPAALPSMSSSDDRSEHRLPEPQPGGDKAHADPRFMSVRSFSQPGTLGLGMVDAGYPSVATPGAANVLLDLVATPKGAEETSSSSQSVGMAMEGAVDINPSKQARYFDSTGMQRDATHSSKAMAEGDKARIVPSDSTGQPTLRVSTDLPSIERPLGHVKTASLDSRSKPPIPAQLDLPIKLTPPLPSSSLPLHRPKARSSTLPWTSPPAEQSQPPPPPPSGIDPTLFASLTIEHQEYIRTSHHQATLAAQEVYVKAYEDLMRPVLATLPSQRMTEVGLRDTPATSTTIQQGDDSLPSQSQQD